MKNEINPEKKPEMKPAQPVPPLPIPGVQSFHPVRPAPPVLPVQPLPLPGKLPITHVQSAQSAKPIPAGPPIRVECSGMDEIEEAALQQTAKKPTHKPEPEQTNLWETDQEFPEPTGDDAMSGLVWDKKQGCYHHPDGLYDIIPDLDGTLLF